MKKYEEFSEIRKNYKRELIEKFIRPNLPLKEEIVIDDSFDEEWFTITRIFEKDGRLFAEEELEWFGPNNRHSEPLDCYNTDTLEQICVSL